MVKIIHNCFSYRLPVCNTYRAVRDPRFVKTFEAVLNNRKVPLFSLFEKLWGLDPSQTTLHIKAKALSALPAKLGEQEHFPVFSMFISFFFRQHVKVFDQCRY